MTIEPGRHFARAKAYDLGLTSNGNEQVVLRLVCVDPDGQDTAEEITIYRVLTDKSAEYGIRDLRTLGWTGVDFNRMAEEGLGSEIVEIQVVETEYQGKRRLEVKSIFPIGGMAMKNRIPDEKRGAFGASLRGLVLATQPKKTGPAQSAPAQAQATTPAAAKRGF